MAIPSRKNQAKPRSKKPSRRLNPSRRRWYLAIAIAAVVYWFLVGPLVHLALAARAAKRELHQIRQQEKAKNWAAMVADVPVLEKDLHAMRPSLHRLGYLRAVPGLSGPYQDVDHLVLAGDDMISAVDTILPTLNQVAPLFGFRSGPSSTPPAQMDGREKVQAVVKALPTIVPALNRIYPELKAGNNQLQQVNPAALGIAGPHVVSEVGQAKSLVGALIRNLPTMQREVPVIQEMLGIPTPQLYLLFFENSGELRAGGGFLTAYAFVPFTGGKMGKILPHDIYSMPLGHYHPPSNPMFYDAFGVRHLWLRDSNTSPDIPISVSNIYQFYDSMTTVPHVDGVIFLDTWFVDRLIGDVGGLTLPAPYNVKITQQNANYEMEYLSERAGFPGPERKAFLGVMLKELLDKVMHAHGGELASVLATIQGSLNQKLVTFYFNNPPEENFITRYNWGGMIPAQVPDNGNYLQVVDENIGAHKDNYWVRESVNTTVTQNAQGQYVATTQISWVNPAVLNNWTVVPYNAYIRVYAPMGSTLVSMTGENEPWFNQTYNNSVENKTWFGGHITMPARTSLKEPPATHSMTVVYNLPSGVNLHHWLIQKQPGVLYQNETINVGQVHYHFTLTRDTLLTLTGIHHGSPHVSAKPWL